ncbi:MDIS1-interacting receptor like kinase 2-like [Ziziphus jujuba]|uniref:non-specific serine/threonine protein kinase n=1 Tax=Ziziphus jujuba TaxID=326968 RepID=A0ABM3ZUC2_ZIZJJ|nr:MDIS1-interacting receptor like kinase 2-like [Ziziphus jujuba]
MGDICALTEILHRNIVKDEAHVSDFGIARFLKKESSNWTSFAGTFGYATSKLAYTMEVNEKCNVYGFGIMTMEILMGKHPGDLVSLISSNWLSSPFSPLDKVSLVDILN